MQSVSQDMVQTLMLVTWPPLFALTTGLLVKVWNDRQTERIVTSQRKEFTDAIADRDERIDDLDERIGSIEGTIRGENGRDGMVAELRRLGRASRWMVRIAQVTAEHAGLQVEPFREEDEL